MKIKHLNNYLFLSFLLIILLFFRSSAEPTLDQENDFWLDSFEEPNPWAGISESENVIINNGQAELNSGKEGRVISTLIQPSTITEWGNLYAQHNYSGGWKFRRNITLDNSANSNDLINYQINLTINYLEGKMNSDFSDLRFTDADGNSLSYWIENSYNKSCYDILKKNPTAESGVYSISPDGSSFLQVYCDMETDGGGWTLVLLNSPYSTPPKPTWNQVINNNNLVGNINNGLNSFDVFLGVKYWNLLGDTMRVEQGANSASLSHRAYYDFYLDTGNYYALQLSNEEVTIHETGTSSPGIYTYHNGRPLTTYDADHDSYGSNCATLYGNTAWWYGACWSGSFWGGGDSGGYQNAPYWTSSGSEHFSWGAIWVREEGYEITPAKIWVKVPFMEKNSQTTISMYYGNSNANAKSNGTATFEFFDDFSGTVIDTNKWVETDSGSYISQNDQLVITGGTGSWGPTALHSVQNFDRDNLIVQGKYRSTCESGSSYQDTTMFWWKDSTTGTHYADFIYALYFYTTGSPTLHIYEDGNSRGDVGTFTCGTQYWVRQILKSQGATTQISSDGETWSNLYDSSYSTETPLKVGFTHYQGGNVYIDDIFIKKYTSPEPSSSLGAEEGGNYAAGVGKIEFGILNESNSSLCAVSSTEAHSGYNISENCPQANDYSSLRLFANLTREELSLTPALQEWNISWDYFPPPKIIFTSPTPEDNAYITTNFVFVNVSVNNSQDTSAFINWNNSLVGYWSFQNNASDLSGYGNDGSIQGASFTSGKFGQALEFDGVDDYIDIGDKLDFTSAFTAEAWFKPDTVTGTHDVLSKYDFNGAQRAYIMEIIDDDLNLILYDESTDGYLYHYSASGNEISADTWHHLAMMWDGGGTTAAMKVYLNGLDISSITEHPTGFDAIEDVTANFLIGGQMDNGAPDGTFNGTIDEVRIWNRALSEEEIKASYNSRLYKLYGNFTDLAEGAYEYYAYAIDEAGNTNRTEIRTVTVSLDAIAPTKPVLLHPSNNTYSTTQNPELNWTSVTEENFANYTIEITDVSTFTYVNYSYYTLGINDTNYTIIDTLRDSRWYWRVTAYDLSGNANTSDYFIYTVDTITPTLTFNKPSAENSTLVGKWFRQNITVSDANLWWLNCSIYNASNNIWWSQEWNLTGYLEYVVTTLVDVSGWPLGLYHENCTARDLTER